MTKVRIKYSSMKHFKKQHKINQKNTKNPKKRKTLVI